MNLRSQIRFTDKHIQQAFRDLNQGDASERELFKIINQALDNIERNAFCGIQIPKRLIPKQYLSKYRLNNLWK
jgi:hypothetical protein